MATLSTPSVSSARPKNVPSAKKVLGEQLYEQFLDDIQVICEADDYQPGRKARDAEEFYFQQGIKHFAGKVHHVDVYEARIGNLVVMNDKSWYGLTGNQKDSVMHKDTPTTRLKLAESIRRLAKTNGITAKVIAVTVHGQTRGERAKNLHYYVETDAAWNAGYPVNKTAEPVTKTDIALAL